MEKCFVPAGFDTVDLIKISTGVKHVPEEFQSKFKAGLVAKVLDYLVDIVCSCAVVLL